jgi:PKD repeat protein
MRALATSRSPYAALVFLLGVFLAMAVAPCAWGESYEQAVEGTAGLAHFWPMGEASGSSFTDSIGSSSAELSGGVTLGESGALVGDASTSASFNGSSGAAHAGVDLSGTHRLTVEFWMKWSSYASDDRLALELTPNFNEYPGGLLVDPDASPGSDFAVSIGEGASRNTVFFERPSAGAWHYYAFVIDTEAAADSQITPYVDGHTVSYTKSESGTGAGAFASSTLFWFSRDASSLFGAGSMQDLALYEDTLTAGTIARHYELGEGGPKASFSSTPVAASAGVPVRLNASGSSSPGGSISDYAWDFDGGKTYGTDGGESPALSHTFSTPGTYTVDLRVTDSEGLTATTSQMITVAAALPAYEQAVESESTLAHFWPMGESSGETLADVFAGADAALTGGVTLGEPGGLPEETGAHAAVFDGTSGAAQAGVNLSATHELTVEFWMKWESYASADRLALELTPNFNEYPGGLLIDPDPSGSSDFAVSIGHGASRNTISFERPTAGAWHYYAFVIDTSASAEDEIKPYLDGRAVSYTSTASGTGAGNFASSTLYWMSRDASSLFGAGSMQDLALYEGALTKSEIVSHYELAAGGPKASLTSTPVVASAGVPVHLDASGSSSPAGPITDYAWDFNAGKSYSTDTGETASTTHTFSTPGTYTVDLRVTDGEGSTATTSSTITVAAALPAYEQAVEQTSSLAHFWPMGESSGETLQDVLAGANAALTGGVTLGEPGGLPADTAAHAALFNGSTGAAHASVDLSSTHKLTVEFWMKWSSYGADDHLALELTPNFNEYPGGLLVDPDATPGSDFAVSIGQGSSRNTVLFERPTAGAWHYYAFVIDTEATAEEQITPYVDGKAVSYTKPSSGTGSGAFADSTLYWFSRDASTLFGAGGMQDLALYEDTLSSSTIKDHYELATGLQSTTPPSITGTAQDGQTLIAGHGEWSGPEPISYAYQWQACNPFGSECEDIEGATSPRYDITSADREGTLRVLVTASDTAGSLTVASSATSEIAAGPPSEIDPPSLAGAPAVGEALQADQGAWGGSDVQYSYQWERCDATGEECTDISGATQPLYTLTEGDVEDTVRVRVGASNALASLSDLSPPSPAIQATATLQSTAPPFIAGTPQSGQPLTANPGSWLGISSIGYAYQWQRCDEYSNECTNIKEATEATYTPASGDVGHALRVHIQATEAIATLSQTTAATQPIAAGETPTVQAAPVISGTALQGYTLSATEGSWSGEPASYAYQWERCDEAGANCSAISGATSGSYTLTESDIASTLRVLVSTTNSHGSGEGASSATATIGAAALTEVSSPSISGEASANHQLTADPGIWTGTGEITYAYQWQHCNEAGESCTNITEATGETYRPTAANAGQTIEVQVTVTGPEGTATADSPATTPVSSEATAPLDLIAPSIEGDLTTGETLSADPGTWVGSEPITYTYQWQACSEETESCTNISGATASTYTLTESEIGESVALTVTATNSTGSSSETVYETEPIGAAGPPAAVEGPVIEGSAQVGDQVFAGNGQWSGSRPLSYYYQWERCNTAGESCSAIEGASKPGYTISSGDAASTLRVKVSVKNSLASAAALSEPKLAFATGEANVSEALEIAQETDPSVLAPSTSASLESETVKPALSEAGEEITSTGTLTGSSVSKETPGEFAVGTADGEFAFTPASSSPDATKDPTIVNGTAALFAETSHETDTIIRPTATGAMTLLQLRTAAAPTSYSWEIGIGPDQQLEKLSDGDIAITEPEPASIITEALPAETPGEPETGTPDTTGESQTSKAAEEELESSSEDESPLEQLTAAPLASTPEITPKPGELHPQETKAEYEAATSATTAAEADTTSRLLMVIKAPSAKDAAGETVPAAVSVAGNTITMTLTPSETTSFPVTASIAATGGTATTAPPAVHYGLSDHKPESFEKTEEEPGKVTAGFDKHLESGPLHVKVARDFVKYNASPAEFNELIEWLKAVTTGGRTSEETQPHLEPYVTFTAPANCKLAAGRESCPAGSNPSISTYGHDIGVIINKVREEAENGNVPFVRRWGAWNEPDLRSPSEVDPLYNHEKKAALFWKKARQVLNQSDCTNCTMVAGEFAGIDSYIAKYKQTINHDQEFWPHKPSVWGLHDYYDPAKVTSHQPYYEADAKTFVHGLASNWGHPRIWISETGVELKTNRTETHLLTAPNAKELQRLAAEDFLHLHTVSERYIELIDYYQYFGPSKEELGRNKFDFDSALVRGNEAPAEDQEPREAYCVIALGENGCPPHVVTQFAQPGSLTLSAATAMLTLDPTGLPTNYFIEYGTTTAYGHTTTPVAVADDTGTQSESVSLSGLEPCTTYHYQAEAEASAGTPSLGGDKTFRTAGCGPLARTGNAIATYEEPFESDERTYELTGEVNPGGQATNYYFEYGPTRANGYTTPVEPAGSGTEYAEATAHIAIIAYFGEFENAEEDNETETLREEEEESEKEDEGNFAWGFSPHPDVIICLKPWHYRIVGVNSLGTNYGVERRITACI